MKYKKPEQKTPAELRKRAEEQLKSKKTPPRVMSDEDTRRLVHELQVHQIELEMQNDELRKSQAELEESRAGYSDLYDFAPVGYFTFDKHGLIREANLTAATELGIERSLFMNKPFRAYIVMEDREIFDSHLQKVYKSDARQTCEIRLKRKDGSEFYAQLESIAVLNSKGTNVCRTSYIDISSRKQTERAVLDALAVSVQRHAEISALLEGTQAVLKYHDFESTAQSIFKSCKELIGATSGYIALLSKDETENEIVFLDSGGLSCRVDQQLPMPIRGFRAEVHLNKKTAYHNDFLNSEWMKFLPKGHTKLKNVLFAPMMVKDKVVGLLGLGNKPKGFSENDTRLATFFAGLAAIALTQKKAEQDLRKSESRYRSYIDVTEQLGWTTNKDGGVVEDLPSWRKFTGQSEKEIKGWGWSKAIHPDDLDHTTREWKNAVAIKNSYEVEYRVRRYDGIYRSFLARGVPVFEKDGTIREWVGTCIDITERKNAEETLKQLTDELKRSNEDLKQFASAASHDLQEPLRGIESFIRLLEKRYKGKLDEKADEYLDYVVHDVKRMQMLIKDLLEYSQVSVKGKVFHPVNCSVVLEGALSNLRSAIEESGAEVTYDLLPTVMGDEAQLSRLFQNLIGNAIKFRGKKPLKIHITAHREGDEWIFSVRDTGIGIDPEQAERIFVIFHRLHSTQEHPGTGVGLAICKKIVERHGGKIWVESEPEKGSTFYFTIPDKEAAV